MSTKTALGKRKRREGAARSKPAQESGSESADEQDVNEIFRRAFEAKFAPLPYALPKQLEQHAKDSQDISEEDELEDESDDAWGGLSDDDKGAVQVVEHTVLDQHKAETLSKDMKRAFMSSKPPSSAKPSTHTQKSKPTQAPAADDNDAANLVNDLALQRLLRESHLLTGGDTTGPIGRNRLKATELRLAELGAKSSVLDQERMPMSHRKGIAAKAAQKEIGRRAEAKENGIILERPAVRGGMSRGSSSNQRRERGVGGPGIGRMSGATLRLSKEDVRGLTGGGRGRGGKRGRGRGRGGKR